ncbi:MAG TPA: hypothetical protein VGH23_01990 [Rhizomicrobium sp.]|jgi:hypothetical protein|nr:hypothetical protein [Acetobacteraceae bacterium]
MSDFFSDLMARVDGTAPVLRPRLPALFETPAAEPQLRAESEMPAEAPERTDLPPQPSVPQPENARANAPASPQPNPFRPVAMPPPQAFEVASPRPLEKPLRGTGRQTVQTVSSPIAPSSPIASPAETRRNRADTPLHTDRVRQPSPAPDHAAPALERTNPAAAAPMEPAASMRTVQAPFAPTPPSLRPQLPPRPQAARREADPFIQISIGRVEIRAASDAPRPPKGSKSSPVMSLEEYLRSRSR